MRESCRRPTEVRLTAETLCLRLDEEEEDSGVFRFDGESGPLGKGPIRGTGSAPLAG